MLVCMMAVGGTIYLYAFRDGVTPAGTFSYTALLPLIWVSIEAPIVQDVLGLLVWVMLVVGVGAVVGWLSRLKTTNRV